MITFRQGNLLEAPTEAMVNTVNTVGVMGKGIALQFKQAFPANFLAYREACTRKQVRVGRMFVTENQAPGGPRWIVNFPTKQSWRQPSQLEWIEEGLKDLRRIIEEKNIRSIAIPPLGCGNGGLKWTDVRPAIEQALDGIKEADVIIFEPASQSPIALQRTGTRELTPARALVAESIRRYWVLGIECTLLEVQKLCWFLQRAIAALGVDDPLNLQFAVDKYGPYSDCVLPLLEGLDGSYLRCDQRISEAIPSDSIWFDEEQRPYLDAYLRRADRKTLSLILERTSGLLDGFESPQGLELLATVDWLIERQHCDASVSAIRLGLAQWPAGPLAAERKKKLFDDRLIGLALERLAQYPGNSSSGEPLRQRRQSGIAR